MALSFRRSPLGAIALTLAVVATNLAACGGDDDGGADGNGGASGDAGADGDASSTAGDGASRLDGSVGGNDGASSDGTSGGDDGAGGDGPISDDHTPPAMITTLVATATGLSSIHLAWTAVGDDGTSGTASAYEIRMATTPITDLASFTAAALVPNAPVPMNAGGSETLDVDGLLATTTYYFAIRAADEVPNDGPISASAMATTAARAGLLVSEVAVANSAADGYDFVELVATSPGRTDGVIVQSSSRTLYVLGGVTLATGDRIVVHVGDPCTSGCVNEDVGGDKTASTEFGNAAAWDVYAEAPGNPNLANTDEAIIVRDGLRYIDGVAISNRDGDATAGGMSSFAELLTATQWNFAETPIDGTNDCAVQREAASAATTTTACGGFAVSASGKSLQRNGTTDTNSKADFYAAAQTRGDANGPIAAPVLTSVVAANATQLDLTFSDEMAPATVTAGAFTIPGLTVSAATLADVRQVVVTVTAPPPGVYTATVGAAVTNLQGVAVGAPSALTFCDWATSPGAVVINEIAPAVVVGANPADQIELLASASGLLTGLVVRSNPSAVATGTAAVTLPAICALAGDLVVVHLSPGNDPGVAPQNETLWKGERARATYASNYDGAWDVRGANVDLSTDDQVFAVVDASSVLDAVVLSNGDATSTSAYRTALTFVQGAGAWLPANCGGAACTDATTPTAHGVSVVTTGVGTTPAGNTVRRAAAGVDTDAAADFSVGASSLGRAN